MTDRLPKIIWTYWDHGEASAPELVQTCITLWRDMNPGWEVRVLDATSLGNWVDPDRIAPPKADLTVQVQSDRLRLELLCRYGGVWADATICPTKPLDDWIQDALDDGLFMIAAANAAKSFRFANWFIAAAPQHPTLAGYMTLYFPIFDHGRKQPLKPDETLGRRRWLKHAADPYVFVERYFILKNQNEARGMFWTTWFARNCLRFYPYHVFHYVLASYLRDNGLHRGLLRKDGIHLGPAHTVQALHNDKSLTNRQRRKRIRRFLRNTPMPVLKLNWRHSAKDAPFQTVWAILRKRMADRTNEPGVTNRTAPS